MTVKAARRWYPPGCRPGVDWIANEGPQERFLASNADEVLYGGAAGGGKSEALLAGALRYIGDPNFSGIIFRRTLPELKRSLIPRSHDLYRRFGGKYNKSENLWTFPSGARIEFGHLEHEESVSIYQGAEFQYIAFDELTHFLESQYTYMKSRLRSAHGTPTQMRAGTNPGSRGHEWVFKRWEAWLDPAFKGKRGEIGEKRYYVRDGNSDVEVPKGTPHALSRTFIPAKLEDTPQLRNTEYKTHLRALNRVDRTRLEGGPEAWTIREGKGELFKRDWYDLLDSEPNWQEIVATVRYWDRASSPTGDWTVGTKICRLKNGWFVILDVHRFRGTPGEVERQILLTAAADTTSVVQWLEHDPGQAGDADVDHLVGKLAGYPVQTKRATKDKVTRAKPHSSLAERRQVKLVRGPWVKQWLDEHEDFPEGDYDDDVDSASGGINALGTGEASTTYIEDLTIFDAMQAGLRY